MPPFMTSQVREAENPLQLNPPAVHSNMSSQSTLRGRKMVVRCARRFINFSDFASGNVHRFCDMPKNCCMQLNSQFSWTR